MATVGSSSCRSAACVLELRVRHVCLLESQCGGAHVLDSQRRQQLRPHRQDRPPIKGVLQHVYPLCPHAAAWRDPSLCTRPDQHAPFGQQPGLLPRRFVAPFCDPTRRRGRTSARIPYGPAVGCESPPPSPLRARHTAIDPMKLDPPTASSHFPREAHSRTPSDDADDARDARCEIVRFRHTRLFDALLLHVLDKHRSVGVQRANDQLFRCARESAISETISRKVRCVRSSILLCAHEDGISLQGRMRPLGRFRWSLPCMRSRRSWSWQHPRLQTVRGGAGTGTARRHCGAGQRRLAMRSFGLSGRIHIV